MKNWGESALFPHHGLTNGGGTKITPVVDSSVYHGGGGGHLQHGDVLTQHYKGSGW